MMLCNFTERRHKNFNSITDVIDKIVRDRGFTFACFRGHKRFTGHVGGRHSHARGGERKGEQERVGERDFWDLLRIYIDSGLKILG